MRANARTRFWEAALKIIAQRPPDFAAMDALVAQFDHGWGLIHAPNPDGVLAGVTHPVGGPLLEQSPGPRCFLIEWMPCPPTQIHAHPPLMYMAVISGSLEITQFDGPVPLQPRATQTLEAGCSDHGWADNDRWDNFPHTIAAHEPAWSLHLYGDDSGRGVRYDPDGRPCPPTST